MRKFSSPSYRGKVPKEVEKTLDSIVQFIGHLAEELDAAQGESRASVDAVRRQVAPLAGLVGARGQRLIGDSSSDSLLAQVATAEGSVAADFSSYALKATPADADSTVINDSAASNALKRLTWANVKATLEAYFDTLYAALSHTHDATDVTGLATAWTDYTPTVTAQAGTFTTVSAAGRYKQLGKIVHVSIVVTITTNGTAATAVKVTLPVAAHASSEQILAGGERATTGRMLQGHINGPVDGSYAYVVDYNNGYPGRSGHRLVLSGTYEAA